MSRKPRRAQHWIVPMLEEWGRQRLRIMTGKLVRQDGSVHEDGWSATSVTDAAREGMITGGSGMTHQHFAEVYKGNALIIWRHYSASPIEYREILHLHFVVRFDLDGTRMTAGRKARILGISREQYYDDLEAAESYLAGRVDLERQQEEARIAAAI